MNRNHTLIAGVIMFIGCAAADGEFGEDEGSPSEVDPGAEGNAAQGANLAANTKAAGLQYVDFECRVVGSNAGCSTVAACPWGTSIVDLKAACNLELGAVTDAELDGTFWNSLKIVKQSDVVTDGKCTLNGYGFIYNKSGKTGATKVAILTGHQSLTAECDEHDKNGGECHIRGTLTCQ